MKRLLITIILAISGVAWGADKPVHLFILSGQSNMSGMKEQAGFVPEAKKLFSDGEVVTIKVARGGRPIRQWLEEWDEIAQKSGLQPLKQTAVFYKEILAKYEDVLKQHPKFESVTFCWMQGESDTGKGHSAIYGEALRKLIANLRRDLKQPKMAFVIGRLSDWDGKNKKQTKADEWAAVCKVQMEIANEDKLGAWVDCDDLNDKEKDGKKRNDLHYTAEGYKILGQRFARQARAIYEGLKPDPNGRPQ